MRTICVPPRPAVPDGRLVAERGGDPDSVWGCRDLRPACGPGRGQPDRFAAVSRQYQFQWEGKAPVLDCGSLACPLELMLSDQAPEASQFLSAGDFPASFPLEDLEEELLYPPPPPQPENNKLLTVASSARSWPQSDVGVELPFK